MSSAEASIAVAMSASLACVTALSASVPLPRRRLLAKRQRLVQRAPGEAERRRADRHPEQVQRFHADAEAFARLADDRVGRNADVVVFEPRERMRRDDLDPLGDLRRTSAGTMKADSPRDPSPSPVRAKVK